MLLKNKITKKFNIINAEFDAYKRWGSAAGYTTQVNKQGGDNSTKEEPLVEPKVGKDENKGAKAISQL